MGETIVDTHLLPRPTLLYRLSQVPGDFETMTSKVKSGRLNGTKHSVRIPSIQSPAHRFALVSFDVGQAQCEWSVE